MRSTFAIGNLEKFSTPNCAIQTAAGAVATKRQSAGSSNLIFRHAGQNVGDVVLNANFGRDALLRVSAGLPPSHTGQFVCKLRGEVVRMQIGGDNFRFRLVKPFKVGGDAAKGVLGRVRFQIANVLADEHLFRHRQRDGVLQMRPNSQDDWDCGLRIAEFVTRAASVLLRTPRLRTPNGMGSGA